MSQLPLPVNKNQQAESGNGYGYGGKITYFNRYLPDFDCESTPSPLASIEISSSASATSASLTERTPFMCGTPSTTINPTDLDTSPLQDLVIGYQTGMYMQVDQNAVGIPNKLAEAWCRDDLNPNVDVVTYYDRNLQQSFGKIFYRDSLSSTTIQTVGEFSSSRVISQHTINYGASNFELFIDRDNFGPISGSFWGRLSFSNQGRSFKNKVFCRLGGDLDPKIWPVTQINFLPYANTAYDKSTDSLVYSGNGTGAGLYSWSNFKSETLVAPNQFGGQTGIQSFGLSQKGQALFTSYTNNTITKKLFSLDLISKKISQISGNGYVYSNGVPFGFGQGFNFDLTSSLAVFRDDSARTSIFNQKDLYVADLSGDNKVRLNQSLPDDSTSSVSSFASGKQSTRMAYTYIDSSKGNITSIGVVNVDGSQRKLFTANSLGLTSIYPFLQFINNDQFILFNATSSTESGTISYALSPSDGTLRKVRSQTGNTSNGITVSQPTGKYLLYSYAVTQDQKPVEYFIRDTTTWKEFSIGTLDTTSVNSLSINEQDQSARMIINQEAVNINLNTQQKSSPCPNSSGMPAVDRLSFSDQSTNYVAKSQSSGDHFIISIYEIKNNQCSLKNSYPSAKDWTKILQVSPNSTGILVAAQLYGRSYISPVHVPLDGRPPVQLNTPVFAEAGISSAYYVNGGHVVVFEGSQVIKGKADVYAISLDSP